MIKYLLMSVRSEWVYWIIKGAKTIELRRKIPRWVLEEIEQGNTVKCLLYCTKALPHLGLELFVDGEDSIYDFSIQKHLGYFGRLEHLLNGKIVAEFDLKTIEEITTEFAIDFFDYNAKTSTLNYNDLLRKSIILAKDFINYQPKYAMHIEKINIFNEPKNLSDYYKYVTKTIYCGLDCPPYDDEVKVPLTKAPQNMMTVWGLE